MTSNLRIAALGLLVTACASVPVAPHAPATPERVRVQLEHLPGDEGWAVTYRFPRPVPAAHFLRGGSGLRQAHWKVLSPAGARIETREDQDVLLAGAGGSLEEVRIRIEPFATKPEKNYQPFIPYMRGGVLAFTGHLHLEPASESGGSATEPFRGNHDLLVPRAGERIVVLGRSYDGAAEPPDDEEGTYAFFGDVAPVQSEHLIGVVDPGAPLWLRRATEELLPKLFAFYAERTHHRLSFKPTVFLSYGEEPRASSISIGGGTLAGLVQLELRVGSLHQTEGDPIVRERVFHVIAHEAAHLWNGQMFSSQVPHGDWMFEGGADAFAYRALRRLGLLSEQDYLARLSEAASLCALGLGGQPLTEAWRAGQTRNFYTCGATLELIAEAAARKVDPHADVFSLWAHLFDAAGPGHRYDDRLFFKAFADGGVPAARIEQLRALVEKPDPQLADSLAQALRQEGIEVDSNCAGAPSDVARAVAQRTVRHALARMCGEARISSEKDGFAVQPGQCPLLGEGARITRVAGRSIVSEPFEAYAALAGQCAASGAVELGLAGAEAPVRAPCSPIVPESARCLVIRNAP